MIRRAAAWLAFLLLAGAPSYAQTIYPPINSPVFRALDANGNPLAGGKLFSYMAGTSTPQPTYADAGGASPNTNPVILDSTGQAKIFLSPSLNYKFILQDASGVQQWSVDNIAGNPFIAPVSSVFGRTGAILAQNGDYSCGQVTGAICSLPTVFYQTVKANGSAQTQRGNINLIPGSNVTISCVDNSGANQTDCTFTAASTVPARTCNSNGCYMLFPDGTIYAWGVVTAPTSGGTSVNVGITFPGTFTANPTLTVSGGSQPDGNDDAYVVYFKGLSTGGATAVVRCAINIGGSGCPSLGTGVPVNWVAIGN